MALVCGKCGNDNLSDARHELQDFYVKLCEGKWMKCFACGWRGKPIEKRDTPTEEWTVPKFATEEDKQAWIAKVRATKERKREAEREAQGRPSAPHAPAVPALRERPSIAVVMDGGECRQALVKLEADAATLRRAIEIIERVNS